MFKNQAGQKIAVFAWDAAAGEAKTADAANITAQISKDGGACAASNDANPTELDATDAPGVYIFNLTQAETNADLIVFQAASSTSDIEFRPVIIYTKLTSADIQSECTDALNAYDPPTKAELDTGFAALNDITVADIMLGVVEGTISVKHSLAAILAFASGVTDGAGSSTIKFKNQAESKNRITMTVNNEGERSSVSTDFTDL